jgi:N-sulfoglucosamine sulfohydrolase
MNPFRLALLLFAAATFQAFAAPNIVVFIVDDMSPDIGVYGNTAIKTPHLDALAADGARFTNAFATTASCSASRSVVLTGLHNHRNGQYGHQHAFHGFESWRTMRGLPILLEECGYRTAQIGKLHVAPYDVYRFGEYIEGNGRNAVQMAENVRPFVDADEAKPFFLYFATSDPHRGGGSDKTSPYKPNLFGNKPNRGAHSGVEEVFYEPADVIVPPFLPDTPATRAELAQYYQSISRIDQGVGRLIEVLKDAGHWDDTLFLFTADHGMAFAGAKTNVYDPALRVPFIVRDPQQEQRGTVNEAMISFVDISPTLLDAAGGYDAKKRAPTHADSRDLPSPKPGDNFGPKYTGFHGRSFLPIVDETNPEGWDSVAASHTFHEIQMYYPMRVVRDRQYKLIWNVAHNQPFPFASDLWAAPSWQAQWEQGPHTRYGVKTVDEYINRPQFELYDISKDPNESTNLAGDSNYAEVLVEYQEKIKVMQRSTNDDWAMKWRYE